MAVYNSLRLLKLLKSWRCLILKFVLPACSIVFGSHELFLNGALALLFFLKTILELGNVSLQLLETGLCVQLGLRREKERGNRGEWREEGREGGIGGFWFAEGLYPLLLLNNSQHFSNCGLTTLEVHWWNFGTEVLLQQFASSGSVNN